MKSKKAQVFFEKGIVFLGLWAISSFIWSFWLDGINTALAGCITAVIVVSVININLNKGH